MEFVTSVEEVSTKNGLKTVNEEVTMALVKNAPEMQVMAEDAHGGNTLAVQDTSGKEHVFTQAAQQHYLHLKEVIRENIVVSMTANVRVGYALKEIKETCAYLIEHRSWEDFLEVEHDQVSRSYASRLIKSAELDSRLEAAGVPQEKRPRTESQARELYGVEENLYDIAMRAHNLAGSDKITAQHFHQAVEEQYPHHDTDDSTEVKKERSVPFAAKYSSKSGNMVIAQTCKECSKVSRGTISLHEFMRRLDVSREVWEEAILACFATTDETMKSLSDAEAVKAPGLLRAA